MTKYRMAFVINNNNEIVYEHDFSFMSRDGWDHLVDTRNDGKMVDTDEEKWVFVYCLCNGRGRIAAVW